MDENVGYRQIQDAVAKDNLSGLKRVSGGVAGDKVNDGSGAFSKLWSSFPISCVICILSCRLGIEKEILD